MTEVTSQYAKAVRHLKRRDKILKPIIEKVGPCTLNPDPDAFVILVRAIISQQISTKAAKSIFQKLETLLKPKKVRPKNVLAVKDEDLKSAGLSTSKRAFLTDLATKVINKEVRLQDTPGMSDEDVIQHLLPVKGIGRWTAEMFLIFALGRLDVLPLADLGLVTALKTHYDLPEKPSKEEFLKVTEPWRPYASIGTWYMWRTFD